MKVHLHPCSKIKSQEIVTICDYKKQKFSPFSFVAVFRSGIRDGQKSGSVYNVYITNQFQTTSAQRGGGVNPLVEVTVNSKEQTLKTFVQITSKNSASVQPTVAYFASWHSQEQFEVIILKQFSGQFRANKELHLEYIPRYF